MLDTINKSIASLCLCLLAATCLSVLAASPAIASEVTGTIDSGSGGGGSSVNSESTTTGILAANVSSPDEGTDGNMSGSVVGGSSGQLGSSGGTFSSGRSGVYSGGAYGIESDGSLALASDYAGSYSGVGGGYDPELDRYLAAAATGEGVSSSRVSPADAVAYNTFRSGALGQLNAASPAAASGSKESEVAVLAILGAAVVALGAYAIHSYLAYRDEQSM